MAAVLICIKIALVSLLWSDLQNAKNSLQKERGYCSKLLLDWTGDMCESYHDKPVYVGFLSAQNEQVSEGGSREGAGGCVLGVFLSTRLNEEANIQCLQKWMQLVESHPDGKPRATLFLACTSRECATAVVNLMFN